MKSPDDGPPQPLQTGADGPTGENSSVPAPPFPPTGLAEAGRYRTHHRAAERGLVVLAMDLPYWMFKRDGIFVLCVPEENLTTVQRQIALYEAESRHWPMTVQQISRVTGPWGGYQLAAWGFFLTIMFGFQRATFSSFPWESHGLLDAVGVVGQGQWWRIFTALSLHADFVHLLSNLVAGLFFLSLVYQLLGVGAGSLAVLFAGALGNLATAAIYYPLNHYSFGFSTAVFGSLGLMAGVAMRRGTTLNERLMPLIAALGLFVMLAGGGATEPRVDHVAHAMGFASGLLLGFPLSRWNRCIRLQKVDGWLVFSPWFIFAAAWWFAVDTWSPNWPAPF